MTTSAPSTLSADALRQLVRDLADDPTRWEPHVHHDPEQRGTSMLLHDDSVEVWVISWMPGHDTGYHDHGGSTAAITVVAGEVLEERLSLYGEPAGKLLSKDGVSVVPALHIHRVRHAGTAPAVSIHAYSPPLGDVGVYSEDGAGLIERRVQPGDHELAS